MFFIIVWVTSMYFVGPILIGLGSLWLFCQLTMGICYCRTSMRGVVAVVIGGSCGIGLETAADLAKRGAHVIVGCRRTDEAVNTIRQRMADAKVEAISLDLGSRESIENFANKVKQKVDKIDILINNAGVAGKSGSSVWPTAEVPTKELTTDGHEAIIGINFLGHVRLNKLLMDLVKKAGCDSSSFSRIVMVSSASNQYANFPQPPEDLDLNMDCCGKFNSDIQYSRSKLALILYCRYLARVFDQEGHNVAAVCVHPGMVRTTFFDTAVDGIRILLKVWSWITGKNTRQGAQTNIHVSVANIRREDLNGRYFVDCRPCSRYMLSPLAYDVELERRLIQETEVLLDLKSLL